MLEKLVYEYSRKQVIFFNKVISQLLMSATIVIIGDKFHKLLKDLDFSVLSI